MKEWKRNKRQKKGKGKEDEVALPCSALRAPRKNKNKNKKKKKSLEIHLFPLYLVSFPLFPPSLTPISSSSLFNPPSLRSMSPQQ